MSKKEKKINHKYTISYLHADNNIKQKIKIRIDDIAKLGVAIILNGKTYAYITTRKIQCSWYSLTIIVDEYYNQYSYNMVGISCIFVRDKIFGICGAIVIA